MTSASPDALLPAEMAPGWGSLPRLAWVAAGGFRARVPAVLLGVARAAAWPAMLQVLVSARAQGRLATSGRGALVVVTPQPRSGWWRSCLAGVVVLPVGVVVALVPALAMVGAGLVAALAGVGWLAWALVWGAPVGVVAWGGLAVAAVMPALAARGELAVARRDARQRWSGWVEASTLVVDPAERSAGTVMVRRLLRLADEQEVVVVAYARDESVAGLYGRLGFIPMPGSQRALYRCPRRRSEGCQG